MGAPFPIRKLSNFQILRCLSILVSDISWAFYLGELAALVSVWCDRHRYRLRPRAQSRALLLFSNAPTPSMQHRVSCMVTRCRASARRRESLCKHANTTLSRIECAQALACWFPSLPAQSPSPALWQPEGLDDGRARETRNIDKYAVCTVFTGRQKPMLRAETWLSFVDANSSSSATRNPLAAYQLVMIQCKIRACPLLRDHNLSNAHSGCYRSRACLIVVAAKLRHLRCRGESVAAYGNAMIQ